MVAYRLDIKNGELFDGKYTVVRQIGSGSYGDVFKVKDVLGNDYALKLLRLWEVSCELHEPLVNKFQQEYNTGRISSEYLIHSLDFGIVNGNPYLLMEFCPQGDLSNIVGKSHHLIPNYAYDILEGLHALHSEGKIHRDMKPENVLLRNNGKAALTDFGVVGEMDRSKRMSEVGWWRKRPKQVQGTPLYMAPEMVERVGGGITYLPTVDIWSFGVMMYEIVTDGNFPFGNIDKVEDLPLYQKRAKNGEWDTWRLKSVPNGEYWTYIIRKCLMPDYRERYQNVLEIMHDMKPMINNTGKEHTDEHLSRSHAIRKLVITQGDNLGAVFILNDYIHGNVRMLRVGRENRNDIILPESNSTYVSRYHFTLEKSADGTFWTIRDGQWQKNEHCWVASTNGTYLNSTPVSKDGLKLFTGDIITAGEYKIKIE